MKRVWLLLPVLVLGCSDSMTQDKEYPCPCADDWVCVDDVCRPPCSSSVECAVGFHCAVAVGACVPENSIAGDDVPSVAEVTEDQSVTLDSGPKFGNVLGWKVVNVGEKEVWNDIYGIDLGGGKYQLFLAGGLGSVLWFDSAKNKWTSVNIGANVDVKSIYAVSPEYMAICGEGGLVKRYFDWKTVGQPEWYDDNLEMGISADLEAIHGTGTDDIWAVGLEASVVHFADGAWQHIQAGNLGLTGTPPPDLHAVLSVSPNKTYIGGDGVFIVYEDGLFSINPKTSFEGYEIRNIQKLGDKLWIAAGKAGDEGNVFEMKEDGSFALHEPNTYSPFKALWISPTSGKVFAAGAHPPPTLWVFDGNDKDSWDYLPVESPTLLKQRYPERILPNSRVSDMWGIDDQNLYVTTKEKQVIHYALHE